MVDRSDLVEVACSLCGLNAAVARYCINGYQVVECPQCHLWYVNPRPAGAALARLYDEQYYSAEDALATGETQWSLCSRGEQAMFRQVLEGLARVRPKGRLLDVGAGYGFFLDLARQRGYQVSGVEVACLPAAHARDQLGLDVRQGRLEEAGFADGEFDAVTMLNVVEHLEDPLGSLREANRVLAPGGVIALVTPNLSFGLVSRLAHRLQRRPHMDGIFDVPFHLHFFSPKTLQSVAEKGGFTLYCAENAPVIENISKIKTTAKRMVKLASDAVHRASGGRLLLGYSMLLLAVKQ
ncbi:MAG: class I SAM-dependent methyltransferase [Bacteroidetes bacterium]|nr:class I SAM-dependent methyltransferase [Bacteroidota bacterium]MCL5026211.1 class I SAM-dependent methyltransferase [Chloroflexota bacterium]